jgi:hypothetical protein
LFRSKLVVSDIEAIRSNFSVTLNVRTYGNRFAIFKLFNFICGNFYVPSAVYAVVSSIKYGFAKLKLKSKSVGNFFSFTSYVKFKDVFIILFSLLPNANFVNVNSCFSKFGEVEAYVLFNAVCFNPARLFGKSYCRFSINGIAYGIISFINSNAVSFRPRATESDIAKRYYD